MSNTNISNQPQYNALGVIPNSSNLLALKTSANASGNVKLIDVQIDENGDYEAPKGYAYKLVSVNVPKGKEIWDGDELIVKYDCLNIYDAPTSITCYTGFWSYLQTVSIDFGDGSPVETYQTRKSVSHQYPERGVYFITIRNVTNPGFGYDDNAVITPMAGVTEVWLPKTWASSGRYDSGGFDAAKNVIVHYPASGIAGSVIVASTAYASYPDGIHLGYGTPYARYVTNPPCIASDITTKGGNIGVAGYYLAHGIKFITLRGTNTVNVTGKGAYCEAYDLIKVINLEVMTGVTCENLFNNCQSLQELPETMSFPAATNMSGFLGGCSSVRKLPKYCTFNVNLSFAPCTGVTDRQSVIDMIENINETDGHTLTLNANMHNLVSDVWDQLVSTAASKGWTLKY